MIRIDHQFFPIYRNANSAKSPDRDYLCSMKTVLTTLNAKYIHTSLALRWLYVANKADFDLSFKEYAIKEDVRKITDELLAFNPDIIGFGVYIWNVDKSMEIISMLKSRRPELILIAGGPEVSYEPEYFLRNRAIDYIISGEGEFVLGELLHAIEKKISKEKIKIESVSSFGRISRKIAKADLKRLAELSSPYMLKEDREDRKNRMVYFETSRGCPYQCSYCLSSLEKGIRYFSLPYIFRNLQDLIDNNAQQVKFLDRTFNLNKKHTKAIFDFLIRQYKPGLSFQFEIYADLLDDEMIEYLNKELPPHYFRFEIGIQSTYEPTNEAVNRKQNFLLPAGKIRKLTDGRKVDLHLDLIAGLPHETFERFGKSFNDVFSLGAAEVQLGFLKMLRGTSLRRNAGLYGYKYSQTAPYEICSHKDINAAEIKRIHAAERALDQYWNSGKFKRTMKILFDTYYKGAYFELFDEVGRFCEENNLPEHSYHLEDIFLNFHRFLLSRNIDLFNELRTDYYSCFKIRPHGFWENKMDKKERKRLLYRIGNDKNFLQQYHLTRQIIEKHTAIDRLDEKNFLLTVFCNDGSRENPLFIDYSS
jgi:radical SAM superfamily enzyme YgiQ (UPF0313 family)